MNKIVSASEFKATCLKLIAQMQKDGFPVTITKRGKPVAEVTPKRDGKKGLLFGSVRGEVRWFVDPAEPAGDVEDWDALR